ncbi:MAG: cytochrome c [SAR324 cluster bacterium]|nr:cytochrome c [SAR324 cluster bacterium]MBF0352892.1 cytochrome c [SAR324 cluster bacterium]
MPVFGILMMGMMVFMMSMHFSPMLQQQENKDGSGQQHASSPMMGMVSGSGTHCMSAPPVPAEMATRTNPLAKTPESVARGGLIFNENCASCHGTDGRGDGPAASGFSPQPANLLELAKARSEGELAWRISNGFGAMPAWKSVLQDEDIWHVVNFIQTLQSISASK